MKLTHDQFKACAYIFERENGNIKSDNEIEIIVESGLADFKPELPESEVADGLDKGNYYG